MDSLTSLPCQSDFGCTDFAYLYNLQCVSSILGVLTCDHVCRLIKLLESIMDGSRLLIFMETKRGCDQVTRQLRMDGWPALSIHGDKSQAERDWVLSEFKAGKSPIMTATDVAARGLGRSWGSLVTWKAFLCLLIKVFGLHTLI